MAFNGSGVFVVDSAGQPVVSNTLITSAAFNALTADLATGLSTCILKDGTQTVTANIPFNGNKITGLGLGTAQTDAASLQNLQNAGPLGICEFRLTLTTAVPVTTTDVASATTIYCTPYKGNRIALFDGTDWHVRTSAEFSLALGTLTSGKPYDVFCYDNVGVPTLEFLVWTDDTTRATALVLQNGVLSKTGALTRRYLGTFYTISTTQTADTLVKRYLWNYYNRVVRPMRRLETTGTWNYSSGTIRQANGSALNQLNFVIGVSEDAVSAQISVPATSSAAGDVAEVLIGLDTTSSGGIPEAMTCTFFFPIATYYIPITSSANLFPGTGRHFLSWNETVPVHVGTTTWAGINQGQSGIYGNLLG